MRILWNIATLLWRMITGVAMTMGMDGESNRVSRWWLCHSTGTLGLRKTTRMARVCNHWGNMCCWPEILQRFYTILYYRMLYGTIQYNIRYTTILYTIVYIYIWAYAGFVPWGFERFLMNISSDKRHKVIESIYLYKLICAVYVFV